MTKELRRVFLLLVLAALALTALACSPSAPSISYDREIQIVDQPDAQDQMAPGLYCLVSTGEGSHFDLVAGKGSGEKIIRTMDFSSRAWVEVFAGETLKYKAAQIETHEERDMKGCYPTRLSNGFFLIGLDLFPGTLTVRGLDLKTGEAWLCEVYDNAHDLSAGPVRSYEFNNPIINVEVENGDFLYLRNTEAYIPPS